MFELPEDVVIDILKRLPAKSIGQFRCVSKEWRSLLSSSRFFRPNLEFHKDSPKQFIVIASPDYYIVTLNDYQTDDDAASETADDDAASQTSAASISETENAAVASETDDAAIASEPDDDDASESDDDEASEPDKDEPFEPEDGDDDDEAYETSSDDDYKEGVASKGEFPVEHEISSACSCDGLVLLVLKDAECSKIVFNPITSESAKVVDNRDRDLVNPCVYGFGYDSLSDDYKIVSLSKAEDGNGSLVDVYSIRNKSWKRIANSRHVLQKTIFPDDEKDPAPGVFLNGRIHWLGSATNPPNHGYEIVCFDLAREEFVQVPLALDKIFKLARRDFNEIPNPDDRRVQFDISVIDGCLALAMLPADMMLQWWYIYVWVMKEYGVQDSWTKIPNMRGSYCEEVFVKIVCALNEDEIVVAANKEKLCAYNLKKEWFTKLDIASLPSFYYSKFQMVLPFKGSVLSPNY